MAIIKAGTYRFRDILSAPSAAIDQTIAFQCDAYVGDAALRVTCNGSLIQLHPNSTFNIFYKIESSSEDLSSEGITLPNTFCVYEGDWNMYWHTNPDLCGTLTITLTEDAEVSAEFAAWFDDNAVPHQVIKAGTYQFHEKLTLTGDTPSGHFKYTVRLQRLFWDQEGNSWYDVEEHNGSTIAFSGTEQLVYFTDLMDAFVYDADEGWRSNYGEEARIITVAYDQEVEGEFCAWFRANVKSPIIITYNGTSTSLEIGKTATITCNNKKMKSDIVLSFGSNGSITYNGTQTSVESGKTAIVQCAGKKMLTDLMITAPSF